MTRCNLMTTIALLSLTATLTYLVGLSAAQPPREGILLLAHGGAASWNARVDALAVVVNADQPTEVAFGMASRPTIQAAIDRLAARGVTSIVAVPLFVSSHSSVIRGTEYLLGLRQTMPKDMALFAKMNHGSGGGHGEHQTPAASPEDNMKPVVSPVPLRMTPALNRHRLVAKILASRAQAISAAPATEAVILVAHGPSPDADNVRWLEDMAVLADGVRKAAPYAAVEYLTVRDDAPPDVRDTATAELRALVSRQLAEGRRVLIVPLLMSFGGIEHGIRKRLEGLHYTMAPQGLMPDDRLVTWVREMAQR